MITGLLDKSIGSGGRNDSFGDVVSSIPRNMTRKTKDIILEQIQPFLYKIGEYLDGIRDPKDKIEGLCKLLPYLLPKMQSVEVDQNIMRDMSAEEKLKEMNDNMNKKLEEQKKLLQEMLV